MAITEKISRLLGGINKQPQVPEAYQTLLSSVVSAEIQNYRNLSVKEFRRLKLSNSQIETEQDNIALSVQVEAIFDGTILVTVVAEADEPSGRNKFLAKCAIEVDNDGEFQESDINYYVEPVS